MLWTLTSKRLQKTAEIPGKVLGNCFLKCLDLVEKAINLHLGVPSFCVGLLVGLHM